MVVVEQRRNNKLSIVIGREIDEHGNLVKQDTSQLKTLAANLAVKKKKENPYLAHKEHKDIPQSIENEDEALVDDRLLGVKRDLRGKKSLRFVEAGKYLKEAEALRLKEERKIIAGYASGRKALQVTAPPIDGMSITPSVEDASALPPRIDTVTPSLEWWDEQFLSKDDRSRRIYDHQLLDVKHCKTYKYVQHPIPIKPLGVEKKIETIPTYLTKQERKKLRKATRREREMEKRDKMMMGLIPAPEPKFKLSNFMKILGDQAVADPSKVEMRVMQQMQQRVLNHEMRNQAAKLTPKERKDKKMAKLQEDTSKGVSVAVFRVKNFQNPKHRFKVDVNAQQLFLSGIGKLFYVI